MHKVQGKVCELSILGNSHTFVFHHRKSRSIFEHICVCLGILITKPILGGYDNLLPDVNQFILHVIQFRIE